MDKARPRTHDWWFECVLRDVQALRRFQGRQQIQRAVWDLFQPDIKRRFIDNQYVRLTPNVVYLEPAGLNVLGYSELGG